LLPQEITIWEAIQKRIYKADAKNEVKIGSERQLSLSHYLEKEMSENISKKN
jgi:hypothetical protein